MVDKVQGVFNKRAKLIYELQHQQQAASLQQVGGHVSWDNLQHYYTEPGAFFTMSY